MPQRRRVVVLTKVRIKVEELARSLAPYDIECVICDASLLPSSGEEPQPSDISAMLRSRGKQYWHKAVIREETRLFRAPRDGLAGFRARDERGELPDDELVGAAGQQPLEDGEAVIVHSELRVWMLPREAARAVMNSAEGQTSHALHTHPIATDAVKPRKAADAPPDSTAPPSSSSAPEEELISLRYTHAVEGYVDASRKLAPEAGVFGWDDVIVLLACGKTYHELKTQCNLKYSPRDFNVSHWVIDKIHYAKRKTTNFINKTRFDQTVSFEDDKSVAHFVRSNPYFNNSAAVDAGLADVFAAVANNGAFFRAATTRREVNYWLPGLNAGIPFVAKRDPIHEITFTAHDFGHFLIPDLIYTGNNSDNARRTYILYRMLSEATTMVFADMLFVETLRLSGHEYDWTRRKIHPLFVDTGLQPFGRSRAHFFSETKKLLEANVHYCLLGSTEKYESLIRAHRGEAWLKEGTCKSLEEFKGKFMPFFVEDYRWTSANFANMSKRSREFKQWWGFAQEVVQAANLQGMKDGTGLETVDDFMAAVGIDDSTIIKPEALITKLFERVFATRITPVLSRPERTEVAHIHEVCLKNAYARYLTGQLMVFARYDFVPEAATYRQKLVETFSTHAREGSLSPAKVKVTRGLYAQWLRILLERSLITPDDYENWQQIFPLFDPVYVFYDESKDSYAHLADVQAEILAPLAPTKATESPPGLYSCAFLGILAASVAVVVRYKIAC